jgi:hypothetical protein
MGPRKTTGKNHGISRRFHEEKMIDWINKNMVILCDGEELQKPILWTKLWIHRPKVGK